MKGHINIFEERARRDAAHATGRFDKVVTDLAEVLMSEWIGENERSGELTSAHEKASSIDGPNGINVHLYFPRGRALKIF
jgi:hypothetical protein